jgi:hypothetical protein
MKKNPALSDVIELLEDIYTSQIGFRAIKHASKDAVESQ